MKKSYGFTLIELLIVMAILGVLAVVVLVAINPVQQLARTRDAGRKSAVTQIGHALEAFATVHEGQYLTDTTCDLNGDSALDNDWQNCLVNAGELSTAPALITYSLTTACSGVTTAQNGVCYVVNGPGTEATIYATLESDSEGSKCDVPGDTPYFAWSTADGRGGLICISTGEPGSGSLGWNTVQ
ncbi:MAG TPA: type II secretion system protein [Patescibacteria group bacterium]|nr:type II secretion system protein [Patescibacteria group bacterium]